MKLVILASGLGSRLGNLTSNKPKFLTYVNENRIIDYMINLSSLFEETIIIGGHKFEQLENIIENSRVLFNKDYLSTNMVHSLFLSSDYISNDFITVYGDIIFDSNIVRNLINNKKTILPIKRNWFDYWKLRMDVEAIKKDAENIIVDDDKILEIGSPITTKMPQYQFMGIIKFNYLDFINLKKFYKKIDNKKIDMTSFLNQSIKNNISNIYYTATNDLWLEIDNKKDLDVAKKILSNYNLRSDL